MYMWLYVFTTHIDDNSLISFLKSERSDRPVRFWLLENAALIRFWEALTPPSLPPPPQNNTAPTLILGSLRYHGSDGRENVAK